jgi:leishmanolysin
MQKARNHSFFILIITSFVFLSYEHSPDENTARALQASQYPKIRMLFDFTYTKQYSQNVQTYVSKTIFGTIKRRLERFIRVKEYKPIASFNTTACDTITIPNIYRNNQTEADLLVFVIIYESNDEVTAFSKICAFDKTSQRPIIGALSINYRNLKWGRDQIDPTVSTVLHEMMHLLIISPMNYGRYPNYPNSTAIDYEMFQSVNATSTKRVVLATDGLANYVRDYFNCPTLLGAPLEDEGNSGSANSHWEKLAFGNELMTSQKVSSPALSMFTFYLMNDSGWYIVDFADADDITWGKYQGCEFIKSPCSTKFKEFCSVEGKTSCSTDYGAKTVCYMSPFSNDCFYNEYARNYACANSYDFIYNSRFEVPGADSRCFEVKVSGINQSNCLKSKCTNEGISFTIEGNIFTCSNTGQIVKYRELEVICPDISDFCNKSQNRKCLNDCNGKGVCTVAGECRCDYFYTGVSCEIEQSCHEGDDSICEILKQSNLDFIIKIVSLLKMTFVKILVSLIFLI